MVQEDLADGGAVEAGRRSGALPQERERAWEAGSLG